MLCTLFWTIYAYLINNFDIFLPNFLGFILALINILVFIKIEYEIYIFKNNKEIEKK